MAGERLFDLESTLTHTGDPTALLAQAVVTLLNGLRTIVDSSCSCLCWFGGLGLSLSGCFFIFSVELIHLKDCSRDEPGCVNAELEVE